MLCEQAGRSLCQPALSESNEVLVSCPQPHIYRGSQNQLADHLSRTLSKNHKWSLNSSMVRSIFKERGILSVDLFAIKDNKKCHQVCLQMGPSPGFFVNAFQLNWGVALMYAFPTFPVISQVILKLKLDHDKLKLLALGWPRQCWFSTLLSLSVSLPRSLSLLPKLLTQHHCQVSHPELSSLHLTVWMVYN